MGLGLVDLAARCWNSPGEIRAIDACFEALTATRTHDELTYAKKAAIVGFTHLLAGFDNPTLVRLVASLLDRPYSSRQATYDLRRLKRKGLISHIPGRHRH